MYSNRMRRLAPRLGQARSTDDPLGEGTYGLLRLHFHPTIIQYLMISFPKLPSSYTIFSASIVFCIIISCHTLILIISGITAGSLLWYRVLTLKKVCGSCSRDDPSKGVCRRFREGSYITFDDNTHG
jgi:hypothetical protein